MNLTLRSLARPAVLALLVLGGLAAPPAAPAQSVPADEAPQRTEPPVNDTRDPRMPPPGDSIGPATFTELDSDGDGRISRDEAALDARLAQSFSTHDKDGDGSLSLAEYQAGHGRRGGDK